MVNEYEDSVSENRGEVFLLHFPVPDGCCIVHAIGSQIKNWPDVKQDKNEKSSEHWKDLQSLRVLDIAETEEDAERAKYQNWDWVDPWMVCLEGILVAICQEWNTLIERFGGWNILQAHRTIHVNNQNSHNSVLDPRASNGVCYWPQFVLFTDVKLTVLVLHVGIVQFPL